MKLYQAIARTHAALKRGVYSSAGYPVNGGIHAEKMAQFLAMMPSGSGFDAGTRLDEDKTNDSRLVFTTAFHHMDEHGTYAGWTEHTVTVRASL